MQLKGKNLVHCFSSSSHLAFFLDQILSFPRTPLFTWQPKLLQIVPNLLLFFLDQVSTFQSSVCYMSANRQTDSESWSNKAGGGMAGYRAAKRDTSNWWPQPTAILPPSHMRQPCINYWSRLWAQHPADGLSIVPGVLLTVMPLKVILG